ncbi:calcium-binding protein [Actinokineospora sp.]|uniref:calcium-binding protein n=1 Tax=Actinokineospora sp. TaxID=1872133 RepID=UPI003D6AF838
MLASRKSLRVGALAAFVVAQAFAAAGTAQATTASVQVAKGMLIVQAAKGQVNKVSISHVGDLLVITDAAPMEPGAGCKGMKPTEVVCPVKEIASLWISLADLDDSFTYVGALRATVGGGTGNDTVTGGWAGDTIEGGDGNDMLNGEAGDDTLIGGEGNDLIQAGSDNDALYGDFTYSVSTCGTLTYRCNDTLYGGGGNDRLYGGYAGDKSYGGYGDDVIHDPTGGGLFNGGPGDDDLSGGSPAMRDTVDYSERTSGVTVILGHVDAQTGSLVPGKGGQPGESDLLVNVQNIAGGSGDDILCGNDSDNLISGNGGIDQIDGYGTAPFCIA